MELNYDEDEAVLITNSGWRMASLGSSDFTLFEEDVNGERLAATYNACNGIENPEAIPELVKACKAMDINAIRHDTESGFDSFRRMLTALASLKVKKS